MKMASEEFARKLDQTDSLHYLREEFYYPTIGSLSQTDKSNINYSSSDSVYLCSHSLGLQPKRVRKWIDMWLNDWANLGIRGHLEGSNPFSYCDLRCVPTLNSLVGAKSGEVAVMNQLTSNLHFLLISLYRPTPHRFKILYEERPFPSDEYAIHSHMKLHQLDPTEATVMLRPRKGETSIRTEDIIKLLEEQGQSIALVLLSGIQFYTGQLFHIKTITRVAQQHGCIVGWDLAHVVGNIPVKLHDWNVDFAVWCSYKYLNGGFGGVGCVYVHSNHFDKEYPSLDGWWGNRKETRFIMHSNIDRECGANGFRVSTPSINQCATLAASLEIFEEIDIQQLRYKSKLLTQYLQNLVETELSQSSDDIQIKIITPDDPDQRGAQLSFRILNADAKQVLNQLGRLGVVADIRNDVIRAAPVPLYNSFLDVYRFVSSFKTIKLSSLEPKQ